MQTKATLRAKSFAPGTSNKRDVPVTLRLVMAKDEAALLEMGIRIAQLRRENGLTQQEIADYCDVDKRTYQFWQAGDTDPKGPNLLKLAKILGVTPKYILRGETPEPLSLHASQLDRIEQAIADLATRLEELENQQQLARVEMTARDVEAQQRLDAGVQTILASLPPQQP